LTRETETCLRIAVLPLIAHRDARTWRRTEKAFVHGASGTLIIDGK
jgi:hypothetical protein